MSNNNNPVRPDVPHHIKESLTEIIDYLWADELKHVREMASNHSEIHLGECPSRSVAWWADYASRRTLSSRRICNIGARDGARDDS